MDPDPDPDLDPDPSINKQKSDKTLISTILRLLFDFLSMKTDINVPSISNKQKNFGKSLIFFRILSATDEKSKSVARIHNTA